jgi:hypothetical protein
MMIIALAAGTATSSEYPALDGVQRVKAVLI